jgi:hypothetical protein
MWMRWQRRGGTHWCSLGTATTTLSSLPLAPPAFPLLLESRAYAGRAERVGVSGGVDEHHSRAGHPLSRIYHTHIPRA